VHEPLPSSANVPGRQGTDIALDEQLDPAGHFLQEDELTAA
jgi:hypothetical protein